MYACNILEDHDLCEDIVQDIFTYLYLNRKTIHIDHPKSYFYQSVKFQVIRHLRKKKLSASYIERFTAIHFSNQTEELLNVKELEARIQQCLDKLPNRCKEIFYLSRYEQLRHEQIAEKLGISVQTVKNQVTKALNYLRDNVEYLATILLFIS